ncbi:MAG: type IV pilus secretin PilQ [Myxococcales bacterium]|nr:type IV pilus secretin PilQ [Myxococcales bacterium]
MLLTRPKNWTATLVVATAALMAARPALADGKNEIRAVTFDDDATGTTRVHVRGEQTPTFTVYKLERPSRVVIDVPQARLAESLRGHEGASVFTPSTWAVSTIAAQQLDDGGQMVRVIVTLARPGRYDVKTDGNEVVVMVSARDAAPKTASPEALARAQQAQAAAEKASLAAQAEAERLRKAASDQQARAESAQRAADDAKRAAQQASSVDVDKAKAMAAAAQAEATRAKAMAAAAQADAQKAKSDSSSAQAEVMKAKQDAATAQAEVGKARSMAATAKAEADAVKVAAAQDIARTKAEADQVKRAAARDVDAAAQAKAEAEQARRDAEVARANAAKAVDAASRTKAETVAARLEANAAKADALAAKAEAEQARRDVAQKRLEAEQARVEAAKTKTDIARSNADAERARSEAEAAKADATRARAEAKAAKAEADAAKTMAAAEKREAEADKQGAITARAEAEKLLKDAKSQLSTLDKKALEVQAREDKARAAHAAALAREEAARDTVANAMREREKAEEAARTAAKARDASTNQVASEREKLVADAKAAEARFFKAKQLADAAEARRVAAETAATTARKDLDQTRSTLASVEQQRTSAERAANDAARKRSEAEAAASDAGRRRAEAETAAATATKQRSEAEQQRTTAEQQRKAAEAAAKDAQVATAAAEKQRAIAEASAAKAVGAKHDAEAGLDELMARREAAEKAASELEARSKAEAKAQSEVASAKARQATDAELTKARAAAAKLADERKQAETDLSDRRKAVAQQQAESDRLRTLAAQARDAAEREERRRAQLATQRMQEEKELAALDAKKADASKVATVTPVVQPTTVATKFAKAAFVKDIAFKGDDGSGQVDIAMTGDGQVTLGEVTPTHVELIIDGAELAQKLERKLDVTRFGSPVRAVSSFRDRRTANRVRLIAELASPMTPSIDRDGSTVRWRFVGEQVAKRAPRTQNVPSPVVGGFGAASTPIAQQTVAQLPPQGGRNRKVYRGATVDFDFKDAPIHDLLRTIADTGKVNIVVPDGIDAKVTVRLKRVPWDQALEVILASHGLWYRRDGNLFRIAPRKELDAEDEAEAARREAMIKAESPRSEVVPLNYASAAELKSKLEPMLSPKGRIEVDERTNALIINDVAGNRGEIQRLALMLDTQTPQISIEARIVEARSTFLRQLGIQWGGSASASPAGGNSTGLVFPSSIGIAGGAEDNQTNRRGTATPSDFAINLPAAVGTGEGGAIGFALGSVGGNFNLNLRLSALEDSGTVRIISAPKITVLNNKEAKISQGVSIPISVVSAAGTQTQFVQADLALTVTPYVSQRDCAIAMNLNVTKNEPDFVNVGARGDPTILRKEAKTQMLVADGETSVLGGIYTRNTGLAYKKVPFFGDLPVIGWFFKNRRENDDRTEILVFITPKITNKALLRCQ